MTKNLSFLGTGWSFPPVFDKEAGMVKMVTNVEDIEQSLGILFTTSLGERILQPEYGCSLQDFVFDPITPPLIGYLKDMIRRAILYHEPRIELEAVNITPDYGPDAIEGRMIISIEYYIRETNSRFNFVYDYYLKEGFGMIGDGAGITIGLQEQPADSNLV